MPFGESGYIPKNIPELRAQLKEADTQVSSGDKEASLTPPSIKKQDLLKMPIEEIKQKYARRYQMYLKLIRDRRYIEKEGGVLLSDEEIEEMKKWLIVLNSLDQYILDHKSGEELTLYERQATVFDDTRKFLEAGGTEGYIKLPTGSGKTVLFTEFVEAINLKTLVVVPRELLIAQTEKQFATHAPELDIGRVSGRAKEFGRQVTIITYESLLIQLENGQIKPEDFDCLILDEAHMSLSKKRMAAVKKFDKAIKLGFTATPQYSERKNVGNLLGKEIHRMNIREAIEDEGMLCQMSAIVARTQVDLSSVSVDLKRKDYDEKQLARAVNVAGRNQMAVDFYKKNFSGQTAVAFCVGVEHAEEVSRLYNEAGVPAMAISGATRGKKEILEKYKLGEVKVLCNADLLITGFDEPRASVCINLRPTRSRVVAEQRGGRVLRIDEDDPEKYAYIIDFIDKNIPDDLLPVLFADIADGAQFIPKKKRKGAYGGGGGGGRPPILSIPGLDVTINVEEVMKIVKKRREIEAGQESGKKYRTEASATEELEVAFAKWQALTIDKRGRFNQAWLIGNGYNGLYSWSYKNTTIDDLVRRSSNEELKNNYVKFERVVRTASSALLEIEEAFKKWKKQPKHMRATFNTTWLRRNGYKELYNWTLYNTSLDQLVATSQNLELQNNFQREERVEGRTDERALQELEAAFEKWSRESKRGDFTVSWLIKNGYNGLYTWLRKSRDIGELVKKSKKKKLRESFVYKKSEARSDQTALVELKEAFTKWQRSPETERGKFNLLWLNKHGYNGLLQWSYNHTRIEDLVARSKDRALKENFIKEEKKTDRNDVVALLELEEAFNKWKESPEKNRSGFNKHWLFKNGYGGLGSWIARNTPLSELVLRSKNSELRKIFSNSNK